MNPVSRPLQEMLVTHLGGLPREVVLELLFDRDGGLCGHLLCSEGGRFAITGTFRPLIQHAFERLASGFVLVHNHPSGDPRPSAQDVRATRALLALARAMELEFADHLVIGRRAAVSMRRAGLMD